jgi:hypothetical protein
MTKQKNGTLERDDHKNASFSLLCATTIIDGEKHYVFYIIPNWAEQRYTTNPQLLHSELNAKEFYSVLVSDYEQDMSHSENVDQRFEQLTHCMGVITEDAIPQE